MSRAIKSAARTKAAPTDEISLFPGARERAKEDAQPVSKKEDAQPVSKEKGGYRLLFKLSMEDESWGLRPEIRFDSSEGVFGRRAAWHTFEDRADATQRERNAILFMQHGNLKRLPGFLENFRFAYGAQAGYALKQLRDTEIFSSNSTKHPIRRHGSPAWFRLNVVTEGEDLFGLCLVLRTEDGREVIVNESARVLTWDEVYVYAGDTLYEVSNRVPAALLERYLQGNPPSGLAFGAVMKEIERLPPDVAEGLARDLSGAVEPEIVRTYRGCRVCLSENDRKEILINAAFAYGDEEIEVPAYPVVKTRLETRNGTTYRIERDHEREQDAIRCMKEAGMQIRNGAPRIEDSPIRFLLSGVPLLEEKGIEVRGVEDLEHFPIVREKPRITIAVQSGIDWFDMNLVLDYAGIEVHVNEVVKAIQEEREYVELPDGRIAYVGEAVREAVAFLNQAGHAGPEPGTVRLKRSHVAVLRELAGVADEQRADDTFTALLERIRSMDRIESVPPAEGFKADLRPYQHAGLSWLNFLRDARFGGILADDMGLGKTVQALALLQLHTNGKQVPNLIAAPTSLVYNWEREAGRFTPDLSVLNHTGPNRSRRVNDIRANHLVVTSYAVLRRDAQLLSEIPFGYILLDESQHIKNPASQTFKSVMALKARHRLCLTGTPVENNLSDLWTQMHFANPGLLGSLQAFKDRFATPIEKYGDRKSAERLRRLTFPFVLRRTKSQVAQDLPPKVEQVVFCEMEDDQRAAYEKWRDYYRAHLLDKVRADGLNRSRIHVLQGLTRLRQVCNHPRLVEPRFTGTSGKLEYLFETLEELREEGHKVLVFSQFVKMLDIVRHTLDEQGVRYAYLDGKTKDRQEIVDAFQGDPDLRHFLISLRAGGTGLNLTSADYVIIVDPWWNPAVEWQAIDRTHRIGQDKNVFALKLITRDTVEEKILELQERKKALASDVIATDAGFVKQLTVEQIEELFSGGEQ